MPSPEKRCHQACSCVSGRSGGGSGPYGERTWPSRRQKWLSKFQVRPPRKYMTRPEAASATVEADVLELRFLEHVLRPPMSNIVDTITRNMPCENGYSC